MNPGGFNYATYLEHQGITLVGTIVGAQAVTLLESGAVSLRWRGWNQVDHWRTRIREAAIRSVQQPALGLVLGMIIGERGYLDQELQDWFMATGTVHLLSISGSHLGLVAAVVYWVVRFLIVRMPTLSLLTITRRLTISQLAILFSWPAVALYTLLAGAELATVRSLVMITMGMAAVWFGHDRHLTHTMAVALLLIVGHDPHAIFDISFQLSFLSVFVMIQMIDLMASSDQESTRSEYGWISRATSHGVKALIFSAVLTITTFPIVAFYFNQVPWLGVLTNLAAILNRLHSRSLWTLSGDLGRTDRCRRVGLGIRIGFCVHVVGRRCSLVRHDSRSSMAYRRAIHSNHDTVLCKRLCRKYADGLKTMATGRNRVSAYTDRMVGVASGPSKRRRSLACDLSGCGTGR